jgi:hypothetical protein
MNGASRMIGHRVLVDGMMGSGKSTFARALAARTGLPLIHLDVHYWKPGWVRPSDDEWRYRQCAGPRDDHRDEQAARRLSRAGGSIARSKWRDGVELVDLPCFGRPATIIWVAPLRVPGSTGSRRWRAR